MMQVTLPRLPKMNRSRLEQEKIAASGELHGIDVILRREVEELMKSNPMVIVCMYTQPAISDQYFYTRYELQQKGLNMTRIPEHVMDSVLTGTKHENLKTLCQTQTALIYGEPESLKHMFSITKQNKYLCVLGGLYYDRLVTLDELKKISELPPIAQLQGELVSVLSTQLASTTRLLQNPIESLLNTTTQRERLLAADDDTRQD